MILCILISAMIFGLNTSGTNINNKINYEVIQNNKKI